MPETTDAGAKPVPQTDPNAKASKTLEGKVTIAAAATGFLAVAAGVVTTVLTVLAELKPALEGLHQAFPGVPYLGLGVTFIGSALMIAAHLGFGPQRTRLKIEQLRQQAAAAGDAAAREVRTVEDALAVLNAHGAARPGASPPP